MNDDTSQPLSIEQLAAISDEALDNVYHYGRSKPGNTFGWQANLKSAEFAKKIIESGETDIEKIADAIHKGWNETAKKFVENPDQFDDTEKLKASGKLQAKLEQRKKLMNIEYAQLPEDEKEKDRIVAVALLDAIDGEETLSEDDVGNIMLEDLLDERKKKKKKKKKKRDACYYKVKARYKVWPSAYASGALVKCRKKGAKNWGTKSEGILESVPQAGTSSGKPKKLKSDAKVETKMMTLKDVFDKVEGIPYYKEVVEDYDNKNFDWDVTVKSLEYANHWMKHPQSLKTIPPLLVIDGQLNDGAHRISALYLIQQRLDPDNSFWKNFKFKVQFAKGSDIELSETNEACWKGYHKEGMKTMFGKKYPNCVKNKKEEQIMKEEQLKEMIREMIMVEMRNKEIDKTAKKIETSHHVYFELNPKLRVKTEDGRERDVEFIRLQKNEETDQMEAFDDEELNTQVLFLTTVNMKKSAEEILEQLGYQVTDKQGNLLLNLNEVDECWECYQTGMNEDSGEIMEECYRTTRWYMVPDTDEHTCDGEDEFYEVYGDFDDSAPLTEAMYRGRKVKLGKPMRGDVKKFKVYVRKPNGKVVKVNFGDKNMRIKKSNPKRRKSFRARHKCSNPGPRWKARYWSCRKW